MNNNKSWLFRRIIGLAWAVGTSSWAQVQFPVAAPAPKVGDIAKYRTIDLWNNKELRTSQSELVEVQPDRFVVRFSMSTRTDPSTLYYTSHWGPCRTMQGADQSVCAGSFKFPMKLGDKYTYEKLPWPNGQGHSTATCEVKAEEKVSTPAGAFDTVRIECAGFWDRVFGGTFSGNQSEKLWYAPKINRLVQSEYTNHTSGGKLDTRERTDLIEFVAK